MGEEHSEIMCNFVPFYNLTFFQNKKSKWRWKYRYWLWKKKEKIETEK